MPRKELTVRQWRDEIANGLKYRKEYGLEDKWVDLEALFYNVRDDQNTAGPNIVFSTGDALLSQLSTPNPYIIIKPMRMDTVDGAAILESLDNTLVNTMNLNEEIETATLHAYLFGKGILKLGYDSEYGFDPRLNVTETHAATMSQFDTKGRMLEYGNVHPGMPWAQSVLPHDIIVPWGTRDLENCPWIIHRVVRHVDDVKRDAKYENKSNLKPVMSMEDFTKSYQTVVQPFRSGESIMEDRPGLVTDEPKDFAELWEIHDKRTGRVKVIATGHDKFLRNDVDLLQINGLPFVDIGFTPKARTFWVTPPAHYLIHSQAELLDIKHQQNKQRRMSVLKFLCNQGLISDVELHKLQSADVGAAIFTAQQVDDLNKVIKTLQPGDNSGLILEELSVRRSAREAVGFSQNQQGEFDTSSRRTATEASIVNQASTVRMDRRQLAIARAYQRIFEKVNSLVFNFWTTPRVAEVVGADGAQQWYKFTGPAIKGEYLYRVVFSDEPSDTLVNREMIAMQLFQILSMDPGMDPVMIRRALAQAFNNPQITRSFKREITGNAGVPSQMSNVSQGGGSPSAGGGAGSAAGMPRLPSTAGAGQGG